jgi:hypothetical protein
LFCPRAIREASLSAPTRQFAQQEIRVAQALPGMLGRLRQDQTLASSTIGTEGA